MRENAPKKGMREIAPTDATVIFIIEHGMVIILNSVKHSPPYWAPPGMVGRNGNPPPLNDAIGLEKNQVKSAKRKLSLVLAIRPPESRQIWIILAEVEYLLGEELIGLNIIQGCLV